MKFVVDSVSYDVKVIRKNNKNTYLRVKEDLKIYITTNYFTSGISINNLLNSNKDEIKKMIDSQIKKQKKKTFFNYLGNSYEVFYDSVDDVKFLDDAVFVSDDVYLDKWLNRKVKEVFKERLDYNFSIYKEAIPYPKLKIRNMKTRWGVCNIRDNSVTLNSKLIEYDLDKLDYVIIHELSHFIHFNHSKAFWNQVEKYVPNYKKIRNDMKD